MRSFLSESTLKVLMKAQDLGGRTVVPGYAADASCLDAGITVENLASRLENMVDSSLVNVYKDGVPLPREMYERSFVVNERVVKVVDCRLLDALVDSGYAVLVEAVDQMFPHVGEAARQLELALPDHRVNVAAMASQVGTEVYSPHFDMADVLVVQVEGRKEWRFYAEREPASNYKKLSPEELGPVVNRMVMVPGDVLFVPKYVPHSCITVTNSMHLTFDLSWYGANLFDWAEALKKAPAACVEMPWQQALKMVESSETERGRVLEELEALRYRNSAETAARRNQRLRALRERWSR